MDAREIVDVIMTFLAASDQTQNEEIAQAAKDYTALCKQANSRLRECQKLLQKGLRTEAIQLAEEQPSLLDLVTILDFPEISAWRELCLLNAFPEPPEINIEYAKALNEAYAEASPLETLLDQHRLLNLARAPLSQRLRVLRQLMEKDATTSYWADDVRSLEAVRLKEIETEIIQYAKAENVAALSQIREELNPQEWMVEVPNSFLKQIQDLIAKTRLRAAEQALREMLPAVNDAYSGMHLQECKNLIVRWKKVLAAAGAAITPTLAEQIAPVISWVNEEDNKELRRREFDDACAQLQAGIDNQAPMAELERLYRQTTTYSYDVPDELENQYRRRLNAIANSQKQKRLIIISSIAAAFILAAAGGSFFFYQQNRQAQTVTWVRTLNDAREKLIFDHQTDAARIVRKSLDIQGTNFANLPPIVKASADLDQAIVAEEARAAAFEKSLHDAGDPTQATVQTAKSLRTMALTTSEIALAEEFIAKQASAAAATQQQRDQEFSQKLKVLVATINTELPPLIQTMNDSAWEAKKLEFRKRIDECSTATAVSTGLRDSLVALARARLFEQEKAYQDKASAKNLLEIIKHQTQSAKVHADALKSFVNALPGDPLSADFQQALKRTMNDESFEAWGSLVSKSIWDIPTDNLKQRIEDLKSFQKSYSDSPLVHVVKTYCAYLEKGSRVIASDSAVRQTLGELMRHPIMQELNVLRTSDGRIYYVPDGTKVTTDGIGDGFAAYKGSSLERPQKIVLEKSTGVTVVKKNPEPAPQRAYAEQVLKDLSNMTVANWQLTLVKLVHQTAGADIDPILKGLILTQLLDVQKGQLPAGVYDTYQRVIGQLDELRLQNEPWLDPDDKGAERCRDRARRILKNLPKQEDMIAVLDADLEPVNKAARLKVLGMGTVLRVDGKWAIFSDISPTSGAKAYAIRPRAPDSDFSDCLLEIASPNNGTWQVVENNAEQLPQGSLIFIINESKR